MCSDNGNETGKQKKRTRVYPTPSRPHSSPPCIDLRIKVLNETVLISYESLMPFTCVCMYGRVCRKSMSFELGT